MDTDRVTFGIRPEDISLAEVAGTTNTTQSITATVDVLEPIGEQILVYLRTEHKTTTAHSDANDGNPPNTADELLMSVDPDSNITEEQVVDIVFDRSNLHFFEAESGDAIHHGLTCAPDTTADTQN